MCPLKTVIFVDGQNFKKNLGAFVFESNTPEKRRRPYMLDEKNFNWYRFFSGVIKKFDNHIGREHRLIRVYWYGAEIITPFRIYNPGIDKVIERYSTDFPELDRGKIIDYAKRWHDKERNNFVRAKEDVYEKIQRTTEFLEFKYVGQYVVSPFDPSIIRRDDGTISYRGKRVQEKGVDVGIATDMVAKMPNYDVAILVSGDSDFLPVVRYLKDNLKYVYQFSIAKGKPPDINYLSAWLKGVVDAFDFYDEEELLGKYLERPPRVPADVYETIKDRLEELRAIPSE